MVSVALGMGVQSESLCKKAIALQTVIFLQMNTPRSRPPEGER